MSSHQTVVSTTNENHPSVSTPPYLKRDQRAKLTRRCKLRVDALAHDPLQTHARAHQPQTRVRARVGPRGRIAARRDAALPALPKADRRGHGEERLDERAEDQPQTRLRADPVADAADEGAEEEGRHRGEGLFVREVERRVALAGRALEKTSERERELPDVKEGQRDVVGGGVGKERKTLPVASCQFGIRTKRIWRRNRLRRCYKRQRSRDKSIKKKERTWGRARATHIHPVMKQYAARGIVDRSGLTWVMRCSLSPPGATAHSGERDDDAEGEEDAGTGRPSVGFAPGAGDLEVS